MISWQQVESDRLLCKHECELAREYNYKNRNNFWNELLLNREKEGWTNYQPSLHLHKDMLTEKMNQKDERLFRKQTYLNSSDYLCEVEKYLRSS